MRASAGLLGHCAGRGDVGGAGYVPGPKVRGKIAHDMDGVAAPTVRRVSGWARDVRGVRYCRRRGRRAGCRSELRELRRRAASGGGSVHAFHRAMNALIRAQLPMQKLRVGRSATTSPASRRTAAVQRTASTLEYVAGMLTSRGRSYRRPRPTAASTGAASASWCSTPGVMRSHHDCRQRRRARQAQRQHAPTTLANWSTGVDAASMQPGSAALANYENLVANESAATLDGFGHGTHVASVAAGRGFGFVAAPDHTGVAPAPTSTTPKVLGDTGTGTLSDAIEGINCHLPRPRIQHPRDEPEPGRAVDAELAQRPAVCIAVQPAPPGITVVVAAGNFGKSTDGKGSVRRRACSATTRR